MSQGKLDPVRIGDDAVHRFVDDSFNCAEAIVAAFSVARGESPHALTSLVAPFGGGVGSLGHMCGAISGALVVLGRGASELGLPKQETRALAQELYSSFEREFGTTACRDLTRHDCERSEDAPFDLRTCGKYLRQVVGTTCASLEGRARRATRQRAPLQPASGPAARTA